jgi:hypothetical protein
VGIEHLFVPLLIREKNHCFTTFARWIRVAAPGYFG